MKRSLGSSDSLSAMMSICPNSTDNGDDQVDNNDKNPMYTSSDFQTILDGLDEEGMIIDEAGNTHVIPAEKKRRLSVNQVKALEKNFEVENKLEPERKVKLAKELGLQPRQVAVWFQNRRARWKTKQLERDYGVLKANYDGLMLNYEKLQRDNEALLKEIRELKEKVISSEKDGKSELSAKDQVDEAIAVSDQSDDKKTNLEIEDDIFLDPKCEEGVKIEEFNKKSSADDNNILSCSEFKDGLSCESDTSAILNEDNINNNSPNAAISSSAHHHQLILPINGGTNINFQISPSLSFTKQSEVFNNDVHGHILHKDYNYENYQPQLVKIEEHNFFGGGGHEESCTNYLFCDDQAPSLPWICSDEWS